MSHSSRYSKAGCPTLCLLKGGIPRSSRAWDFSLAPAAPSFLEWTDDPITHPFRKVREKDGATSLQTASSFLEWTDDPITHPNVAKSASLGLIG